MNPEMERIRGYLQSQAAKLSLPELVGKVRGDMEQFREALESVPEGRLGQRPADGEWSANEVAAHLIDSSRSVGAGIVAVLDSGSRPAALPDRIEPTDEDRTPSGWWEQLQAEREPVLERVLRAGGDEHLNVTWGHPMFGELNWREWVLFLRIHDLDHARQVAGIAQALPVTK